jgi:hypothetical protein
MADHHPSTNPTSTTTTPSTTPISTTTSTPLSTPGPSKIKSPRVDPDPQPQPIRLSKLPLGTFLKRLTKFKDVLARLSAAITVIHLALASIKDSVKTLRKSTTGLAALIRVSLEGESARFERAWRGITMPVSTTKVRRSSAVVGGGMEGDELVPSRRKRVVKL